FRSSNFSLNRKDFNTEETIERIHILENTFQWRFQNVTNKHSTPPNCIEAGNYGGRVRVTLKLPKGQETVSGHIEFSEEREITKETETPLSLEFQWGKPESIPGSKFK